MNDYTYYIVAAAGLIIYAIVIYNRLIAKTNYVKEAWSGIDVQLKRRHDLIPNLVQAVSAYRDFERQVLTEVTALRGKAMEATGWSEKAQMESRLSGALGQFLAVVENYPDLKSSDQFINLQKELANTEELIQLARRYFNGTVRDNNILVQSFPSNIVAKLFGFATLDYFEITLSHEKVTPEVKL